MSTPKQEIAALRTQIAVLSALQKTDHLALLAYVESLADFCRMTSIDGLAPHEWYEQKRRAKLERFLLRLEDVAPAAAALLQHEIDELRKPSPPADGK
jgi:hypothetical protein